jgi:hypothetical protein
VPAAHVAGRLSQPARWPPRVRGGRAAEWPRNWRGAGAGGLCRWAAKPTGQVAA